MSTPSTKAPARNKDVILKQVLQQKVPYYSLERSLTPVWKVTYYGGMLLDWCQSIRRGRLSTILRCFVITLALTIFFYHLASSVLQLIWAISSPGKKFRDLIHIISRISLQPIIILTWLLFLIRRRQYLNFFRDWAKQEQVSIDYTVDFCSIRRTFLKVYAVLCVASFCFLFFSIHLMISVDLSRFQDVLIFNFPDLLNFTWFTVAFRVGFLLWSLFIVTFIIVADLVPAFVYYHAAKNIEAIEKEVRLLLMNDRFERLTRIKLIWFRFEEWRRLIRRADQLFGAIIILNHGTSFFLICCDVCSVLNYVKIQVGNDNGSIENQEGFGQILFILANILRLAFSIFMMAKIRDSLSTTLIHIFNFQYHSAGKEERHMMKSFINRLQFGGLVASPAGFYSITPSILLTMLSLIVTYSVIMLQT